MRRLALLALVALAATSLLTASAAARSDSSVRVRGVVALKDPSSQVVTIRAKRQAVALRVPGSLAAIRVGQRVELRGSTLRARGNGSRVLARNVTIASSAQLAAPTAPKQDDDEAQIKGKITSLAPLTVASATRSLTCAVPAGMSLSGLAVGDFVEITCDLVGSNWVLRKIHREDDDDQRRGDDDDDDRSGRSGHDDDDDDNDDDDDHGGHDDDDDDHDDDDDD